MQRMKVGACLDFKRYFSFLLLTEFYFSSLFSDYFTMDLGIYHYEPVTKFKFMSLPPDFIIFPNLQNCLELKI